MRKIVLDCDPGIDDAVAILLALGSPEVEVLAITTVAGNQTLERTTLNGLRIRELARSTQVPVAAGSPRPLLRDLVVGADIHGESGLGGVELGVPAVEADRRHAVEVIVDAVMAHPGEVTLVPTGPLTNVALALRREPRLAAAAAGVVLMGGSFTRGNRTPAAEFNMLVDPEAAAIVFDAPWEVTMVGLDLTHQALADEEVVSRIASVGTRCARAVCDMLGSFGSSYGRLEGLPAPPVHDPCAVAYVIDPSLMAVREAFVAVETQGRWTSGMTVTDFSGRLGHAPNAKVATSLDAERFWSLVVGSLRRLG